MGEFGANIQLVGNTIGVSVQQKGNNLRVKGQQADVEAASHLLLGLYDLAESGFDLRTSDVDHAARLVANDHRADVRGFLSHTIIVDARGRPITPRTVGQRHYVQAIDSFDVVLGVGPAGTGKTYVAVAKAIEALKNGDVRKIVLTRPAVEAGEKLGFLPGDLHEKVDPYLRPLFDAVGDMLDSDRIERLFDRGVIEVAPLAFMRGRTLDAAFVILDEAQNTSVSQMKMFLTRLGNGSKMVLNGDVTQVDLPRGQRSGLIDAIEILADVPAIGLIELDETDVVRHPLVSAIIKAYGARVNGEDSRR